MVTAVADPILARYERVRKGQQKGTLQIRGRFQLTVNQHPVFLFEVWSCQTYKPGRIHYVTCKIEPKSRPEWKCTCRDFEKNGLFYPCKHIIFVQEEEWWRLRAKIKASE